MGIRRVTTPPPKRIDGAAIARMAGNLIIGHIRERVADGVDVDGRLFFGYSDGYAERRMVLGRATAFVNLVMSGGLLGSLKIVDVRESAGVASVEVGLGTGSSRIVSPPPKRRRKARGRKRTHGPPHNLLGKWHQDGAGNNRRRKWFGVSRKGNDEIREILRKLLPTPPTK
jgi:hypothetical protein